MLQPYQREFIQLALHHNILKFGEFTLKSGRQSPYFFNAGLFNTGEMMAALGHYYAQTIMNAQLEYDVLFGPAYKGIPLVTAAAISLARDFQINKPYCFNRKEAKDHGEGGTIVGAPLKGRVLIVEDVISAGTAIRESADIIQKAGASIAGIVISFNRQEKGLGERSAVQELQEQLQVPVFSIIGLSDLKEFMASDPNIQEKLAVYQNKYGTS